MKCVICGVEFGGHGLRKYCAECRDETIKKANRERSKRNYPNRKLGLTKPPAPTKIEITPKCDEVAVRRLNGESLCMWCGQEFNAPKKSIRFCCDTHAALFYNRLFSTLEA